MTNTDPKNVTQGLYCNTNYAILKLWQMCVPRKSGFHDDTWLSHIIIYAGTFSYLTLTTMSY
jgi:hypothetical protein